MSIKEQIVQMVKPSQRKNGFKLLFSAPKIIGLVGDANQGKTNLLYHILDELGKEFDFNVYSYGLRIPFPNVTQIYSVEELEEIRNSIVIIDEMFSLFDLDNRKQRRQIENTLRLVFHNNNVLVLCGLGENFKKFISAKLNSLVFKKITYADLVNGSRVKNIIMNYNGRERGSAMVNLKREEAVVFDEGKYHKINIPYMQEFDTKKENPPILVRKE